jgi:hypothetical protein
LYAAGISEEITQESRLELFGDFRFRSFVEKRLLSRDREQGNPESVGLERGALRKFARKDNLRPVQFNNAMATDYPGCSMSRGLKQRLHFRPQVGFIEQQRGLERHWHAMYVTPPEAGQGEGVLAQHAKHLQREIFWASCRGEDR